MTCPAGQKSFDWFLQTVFQPAEAQNSVVLPEHWIDEHTFALPA